MQGRGGNTSSLTIKVEAGMFVLRSAASLRGSWLVRALVEFEVENRGENDTELG